MRTPIAGLYRRGNDVWEIKEFDGGDKYMVCHGDVDERKGRVPAGLDVMTLPDMDKVDLSCVEY